MTNAIFRGKPDAGNPHVRFDEGEVASAKPRRGSLLYKYFMKEVLVRLVLTIATVPFGVVLAHDVRCGPEQDPNGWAECPVRIERHEPIRTWKGNDERLLEVSSDEGNFKTTVLKGEDAKVGSWRGTERLSLSGVRNCFKSDIHRYSASEFPFAKWYGVEHIEVEDFGAESFDSEQGRAVFGITSAVLCGGLNGLPNISVPSNTAVAAVRWGHMTHPDLEFKERVGVEYASLHHGVVKVNGEYYAIDVALLAREHEIWRLEAGVRIDATGDADAMRLADKTSTGQRAYGHFFWNFKPLRARSSTEPGIAHKVDRVEYPDIRSALWRSVESNRIARLKQLLSTGGNPNFKNERNVSLLGRAVGLYVSGGANVELIDVLLEHGADPNMRWGTGNSVTPFWSLVQRICFMGGAKKNDARTERIAVVRKMLRKGADPNVKCGIMQLSALGYAVMRNADLNLIKVLVEGGAEITDKMIGGDTKEEIRDYLTGVRNGSVKVVPIEKEVCCSDDGPKVPTRREPLPLTKRPPNARDKELFELNKVIRNEKDPSKRGQLMREYMQKSRQHLRMQRKRNGENESKQG